MNGSLFYCNGNFFGCELWIVLLGLVGELKMGLQFFLFFQVVYDVDLCDFLLFGSEVIIYVGIVLGISIFNFNVVMYMSLIFVGLIVSILFVFGGKVGDFCVGR